jgi:hypothetical protein
MYLPFKAISKALTLWVIALPQKISATESVQFSETDKFEAVVVIRQATITNLFYK